LKKNIYCHGYPETYTAKDLENLFSKYGKVESVYINLDENGKSKRNGIIRYSTIEEA